jgi:hypothetical protein
LRDLVAFSVNGETEETIFLQDELLAVQVAVEFSRSGAIALMPLRLSIQVEFFAKPLGKGGTIALGNATLTTAANQYTYHPTLELPQGLVSLGLVPEKVYKVSALMKVGAADFPAFIYGWIEGLTIQTYAIS